MHISNTLIYIVHLFHGGFSERELPYLARQDWNIFMLPRLAHVASIGELPANVTPSGVLRPNKWSKLPFLAHPRLLSLWAEECRSFQGHHGKPCFRSFAKAAAIALHARAALRRLILRHALQCTPLVVYSYWYTEAALGAGMLRAEFPHLRVIVRAHGGDIYPCQSPGGYLPFRFIRHRFVDRVFSCSDDGAVCLREDGHALESVETARLGISPAPGLAPSPPAGQLALVSCSNTAPMKRLPLLVTSIASLAASRPNCRVVWHHLGGGPGFDDFAQHAERMFAALPNLTWRLHGQLAYDDVRAFLSSEPLDCLVNVSFSEGLPVSMMEALAAGLPVIGTDVGGVREIVTPETGVLLPVDFTQEMFVSACDAITAWKPEAKRHANRRFAMRQYHADTNYSYFAQQAVQRQFSLSEQRCRCKP